MARKKTTKNADPAVEYIDSAGVKLNAASDLIIEAKKTGEVISARNLINGVEYVGGGGSEEDILSFTINFSSERINSTKYCICNTITGEIEGQSVNGIISNVGTIYREDDPLSINGSINKNDYNLGAVIYCVDASESWWEIEGETNCYVHNDDSSISIYITDNNASVNIKIIDE